MPLQGRNFREGGFVVYGIGYGAEGGRALNAILASAPMRALFSFPPVMLKPALAGGVSLAVEAVEAVEPLTAAVGAHGRRTECRSILSECRPWRSRS